MTDARQLWPCEISSEEFWNEPDWWPQRREEYVFLAWATYLVSGIDDPRAIGDPPPRLSLELSKLLLEKAAAEGKIQTAVRSIDGGRFYLLPQDLWNSECVPSRFQFCKMNLDDPYSHNTRGTHWIYVTRESLQTLISDVFALSKAIPNRSPNEGKHESALLPPANANDRSKSITTNNLCAKMFMPEEAISLINGGERPVTAALARQIKKNSNFSHYQLSTIERYIRSAVKEMKSRNRSPENPENPGTAV